jgi:hypothetical protein
MFTIDNFKIHWVSRLLAAVCVSLTISASFAAAYVSTSRLSERERNRLKLRRIPQRRA